MSPTGSAAQQSGMGQQIQRQPFLGSSHQPRGQGCQSSSALPSRAEANRSCAWLGPGTLPRLCGQRSISFAEFCVQLGVLQWKCCYPRCLGLGAGVNRNSPASSSKVGLIYSPLVSWAPLGLEESPLLFMAGCCQGWQGRLEEGFGVWQGAGASELG